MSEIKIDLRYELGRFLKKEEATMLTTLVMMQLESGNTSGTVDCTEVGLGLRLPYSRKTNNKWISRLRKLGYILTEITGHPVTKRVVKINYEFMLEKIIAFRSGQPSGEQVRWNRSGGQANTMNTVGWNRSGSNLQYKVLNKYNTCVFLLSDFTTGKANTKTNGENPPTNQHKKTSQQTTPNNIDQGTSEMGRDKPSKSNQQNSQPPLRSGGFFEGTTKQSKLTHFDMVMATRLFNQVRLHRPGLTWRKSKWAHEIRILRNEVEQDTDRIELTIEALPHLNIRPTSAGWFRKNFTWIEERALKILPNKTSITQPIQTKEILDFIDNYNWPECVTPDQVSSIVVLSLGNYESFYRAFKTLNKDRVKHPRLQMEIEFLFRKLSAPIDFVQRWLTQTCELVHKWKNWSGSLKGLEFHPLNKKFTSMGVEWAKEYSGRERDWFQVMELLGYSR